MLRLPTAELSLEPREHLRRDQRRKLRTRQQRPPPLEERRRRVGLAYGPAVNERAPHRRQHDAMYERLVRELRPARRPARRALTARAAAAGQRREGALPSSHRLGAEGGLLERVHAAYSAQRPGATAESAARGGATRRTRRAPPPAAPSARPRRRARRSRPPPPPPPPSRSRRGHRARRIAWRGKRSAGVRRRQASRRWVSARARLLSCLSARSPLGGSRSSRSTRSARVWESSGRIAGGGARCRRGAAAAAAPIDACRRTCGPRMSRTGADGGAAAAAATASRRSAALLRLSCRRSCFFQFFGRSPGGACACCFLRSRSSSESSECWAPSPSWRMRFCWSFAFDVVSLKPPYPIPIDAGRSFASSGLTTPCERLPTACPLDHPIFSSILSPKPFVCCSNAPNSLSTFSAGMFDAGGSGGAIDVGGGGGRWPKSLPFFRSRAGASADASGGSRLDDVLPLLTNETGRLAIGFLLRPPPPPPPRRSSSSLSEPKTRAPSPPLCASCGRRRRSSEA